MRAHNFTFSNRKNHYEVEKERFFLFENVKLCASKSAMIDAIYRWGGPPNDWPENWRHAI
jgi:hypothetical protein